MKNILLPLILLIQIATFQNVWGNERAQKLSELKVLTTNLDWFEKQISKKEKELKGKRGKSRRLLEEDLATLKIKRSSGVYQFIEQASDVNIEGDVVSAKVEERDLLKEVQDLLAPVIDGLRRISERPRQIEALKTDIVNLKNYISSREKALEKINVMKDDQYYLDVKLDVLHSAHTLESQIQEFQIDLQDKERSLSKILGEKKTVLEAGQDLLRIFFKTKGKNLLLALLSLIIIFWSLVLVRRKIFRFSIFQMQLKNLRKPIKALYNSIAFFMGIVGAIVCLYLLNDWVLVTISILIIMGIIFSFKQFVPQFINEAKLIFNLGPVREGERIIWNDVPWRVRKIGFYSLLENELLEGGIVRITARELMAQHSRVPGVEEPWFPTKAGDWVLLSDGTYGQVLTQTPEQIIVRKMAGTLKYYNFGDFLAQSPENLSNGFFINEVLGLDYGVQNKILKISMPIFTEKFVEKLNKIQILEGKITNVLVDFHSAGGSSLNFRVGAVCSGEIAQYRFMIQRKIHELFVEICNEENYEIPFDQLTVHLQNSNS